MTADTSHDTSHEALIETILERELRMFVAVPNAGGPASCQERPGTFRVMRWMEHSVLDNATLASYANDLHEAEQCGRNLMTEKYVRMDRPSEGRLVCEVLTALEAKFMAEAAERFPHSIVQQAGGEAFERYLRAELETYSDTTLELYAAVVQRAVAEKRNLAVERFDALWRKLGYASLEAREAELAHNRFKEV